MTFPLLSNDPKQLIAWAMALKETRSKGGKRVE